MKRNRSSLFFLIALFFAGSSLLCCAQVNLLKNGSFERFVNSGIPDEWTNYGSSGYRAVVNVFTSCGDNVLKITDSSSSASAGLLSDPVAVVAGGTYTAEAYIKRTDTDLNTASIYLKFYDSNGSQVGSYSVAASSVANSWGYVSKTGTAPSGAVTARVLCYSSVASSGTMYFDGVSLRSASGSGGNVVWYVSSFGSGSGTNSSSSAGYNDSAFWAGVQSRLASDPVKVVFLEGDYVVNDAADCFQLSGIGNANNQLVLEGEHPYGSVFTRNNSASVSVTVSRLQYATNVVLRHIHWEDDTTDANKLTPYSLIVSSGTGSTHCQDILIEGCSFVGLDLNIYGALGIHYKMTHDVEVSNCEFIRGGHNSGFHMIYNAYAPWNLLFENNYFQDCSGTYLRLRAGCHDAIVTGNDFVSTTSACNHPFVQLATFNDVNPGDEIWGYNFNINGNIFTYAVTGGDPAAIELYHKGYDPEKSTGETWEYLLTPYFANVLENGSVAYKTSVLKYNYGLVSGSDLALTISDNDRFGDHLMNVRLGSYDGYGSPDYGGDGAYSISDVFPDD